MKLQSNQVIINEGRKNLYFKITRAEYEWFSPFRIETLLEKSVPSHMATLNKTTCLELYSLDDHGHRLLIVDVDSPLNEKLIQNILTQYVLAGYLSLDEANGLLSIVANLLGTSFKSLDTEASEISRDPRDAVRQWLDNRSASSKIGLSSGDQERLAWNATYKQLTNTYGFRPITAVRFLPSVLREAFVSLGFYDHHIQNWHSPDNDTFKVEHAQAAISLVMEKNLSPDDAMKEINGRTEAQVLALISTNINKLLYHKADFKL